LEESLDRIASFILAAGMSKRMGSENKLLKKYNNNTILNQTVKNHSESKLKKINIIIGYDKEEIINALKDFDVIIIENKDFESGMLSSIKKIKNNIDDKVSGIMISLGDMPLVSKDDINHIVEKFLSNFEKKICIPVFNKKLGNPIIIPVNIYKELIKNDKLFNDKGLKNIILENKYNIIKVNTSSGVLRDFDTEKDFN
jgi:molybdenum cofactor cytidylyltransferase|tara:strand:- start:233 stop:829 length:597 start_codon:yes stop_codon:yes gene_type:complete